MEGYNHRSPKTYLLFIIIFSFSLNCYASNIIGPGKFLRDGDKILSRDEKFALGFFSPGDSRFRYIGVWYNKIPVQSVIWVANRETPVVDNGGVLTIGHDGNMVILNGNRTLIWSSNASSLSSNSPNDSTIATLLENGNLVLSNFGVISVETVLWQSFQHPTDTFLPGMRVQVDSLTKEIRPFYSWRSANDPSIGNFSMGIDPRGSPQVVIWEGENRRWRSGHWNGISFIGVTHVRATYFYGFSLVEEEDGIRYLTYTLSNASDLMRFMLKWNGIEEQSRWDEDRNKWKLMHSLPSNECDFHNKCGPFGICRARDSPICSCLKGFVPKDLAQWNNGNWSGGCVRRTNLNCKSKNNGSSIEENSKEGDKFFGIERLKLPDYLDWVGSESYQDCKMRCERNCSCSAYALVQGLNCLLWGGDLIDIQQFEEGGYRLYVRLAASELADKRETRKIAIIAIVAFGAFLIFISIWLFWICKGKLKGFLYRWRKTNNDNLEFVTFSSRRESSMNLGVDDSSGEHTQAELLLFNFNTVAAATNNFSDDNKLGQGGFGPVYKGILPGGQEIAVKRLSRKSGQGLEEFKNEIRLIAKLQHRNLVRLLGCCIQGDEKMLLYEYMPNKSLDSYIFGELDKQAELDWKIRFAIIEGIARGLLYLHRDSRLRIVHRDLKASNILLDDEMNPKISDFGMARIFGGNQNEANTSRIVGTYGYMAPEYAMEGLFSVKSDVYSFGVLLLEIISGRRNASYRSLEYSNIIGYAWDLWNQDNAMELVDPCIVESCNSEEVLKCIHVGMLCVQNSPAYRPTMSAVILMLEGENTNLPVVRPPSFTSMQIEDPDSWNVNPDHVASNNDVTISTIRGR